MNLRELLLEEIKRTGKGDTAVIGWGRGMGHKGHMYLASSVITHAKELGGDPYFVVSRTVGKDDPIYPEEKLAIYKKVFPDASHIFQTATDELPDLTQVLKNLNQQGYRNAVVIVGADQVKAFQYLNNYNGKPNKAGEVPFNFDSLNVISRQETSDPSKGEEGPRATPMRQVLLDPTKSDAEQFAVWRDAMNPEISDDEVRDLMNKAKERMMSMAPAPKKAPAKKKEPAVAEIVLNPARPIGPARGGKPAPTVANPYPSAPAATPKPTTQDQKEREVDQHHQQQYHKHPAGVKEGVFGLSAKEKGKIQYVAAKISDIPGNWDHKNQTYTEQGLKDLKSVMKNEKYLKYALSLTADDYEAEGVAEGKKPGHLNPGWMLKQDPELGRRVKQNTDKAKQEKRILQKYAGKKDIEEDWQKVNKSDKTDGMSKKAVDAYRRENPGSKLKTAVTKKPSKLKAGSKDAKRRKSFCARMSGVDGPMKDEKGRPTAKAKALSRWNCEESILEGKGYKIDQDDRDEFTPNEIERIKNAHFPDTLRDNLRAAKKRKAKQDYLDKLKGSSDGGDSRHITPVGHSSDNSYGESAMDYTAKRLTNKDDGKVAKLRAAGDKRREQQMKGRDIAKRDTTKKNQWGDLQTEVSDAMIKRYFSGAMKDTISGKKDRNKGMTKAMTRMSGTNKPL